MRVAFFGNRTDKDLLRVLKHIKKIIEKNETEFDDTYFKDNNIKSKNELDHIYKKVKNIIQKADIVIVEATKCSTTIGLIIGKVIEYKKPLLILFNIEKSSRSKVPLLLKAHGNKKNKVFFEEYKKDKLSTLIKQFIEISKKILNTKYLLNLTPELVHYLQWASDEYDKPMVDIIREELYKRINNDEIWKKHSSKKA